MGFSFDGIHSKDMGLFTRMAKENRVPELRNHTIEIAGKSGLLDLGSSLSERVIEISCLIPPKMTLNAFLASKDNVVNWLSPDKGLCALTLDTEPGRVYYARLQGGVTFEKITEHSATFDLTFFCPDPFGYAVEDENYTITATGTHVITRTLGTVASKPVYRLNAGIASSPDNYVSITTNSKELKIVNAVLDSAEMLVIDSEKMTAWVENAAGGIARNALPYIDELNFPTLNVGDNTVTIETANTWFGSLNIQAKSRWR